MVGVSSRDDEVVKLRRSYSPYKVQTAPCQVAPQYVRWQAGARGAVSEPEPQVRFELTTYSLPWNRSTTGAIVTLSCVLLEQVAPPAREIKPRADHRIRTDNLRFT